VLRGCFGRDFNVPPPALSQLSPEEESVFLRDTRLASPIEE